MRRFADLFIAICIPVVAASAGAIAYWQFEASGRMALVHAATVLVVLVMMRTASLSRRGRRENQERIAAFDRRLIQLDGTLQSLERRISAVEDGGGGRRHRDDLDQVVAEIEVIGALTRQVIETVADLEVQFTETRTAMIRGETPTSPPSDGPAKRTPPAPAETRASRTTPSPMSIGPRSALVPERFAHLDEEAFLALVRRAIESDRIDLHLQPIVSLPQRKVRFYEALTRLRTEDGEPIHPSDYIPIAESRGYMASIDEQILIRSLAILRRLAERSREVGVFLNLSAASLGHPGFFRDFLKLMEQNRDLAEMLVLEFPQGAVRAMGPIEHEGLKALWELGFRFSVDQIGDLKISFQNLADRGFRYAKISADRLLHRASELGTDIHPVDLTDYFRRFGMELIADHLERESDVVDVLDHGVRLGQGFVFAPPRPVRVDLSAERPAPMPTRAATVATPPVAAPAPAPRAATSAVPAAPAPRGAGGEPRRDGASEARGRAAPVTPAGRVPPQSPSPRPAVARSAARIAAEGEAPHPGIRIVPGTGLPTRP